MHSVPRKSFKFKVSAVPILENNCILNGRRGDSALGKQTCFLRAAQRIARKRVCCAIGEGSAKQARPIVRRRSADLRVSPERSRETVRHKGTSGVVEEGEGE